MLNVSSKVYVSTDATADAASCSIFAVFAAFILIPEESKSNIWIHINHYLSSTKAIPIHEVQKLHCVGSAASDADLSVIPFRLLYMLAGVSVSGKYICKLHYVIWKCNYILES